MAQTTTRRVAMMAPGAMPLGAASISQAFGRPNSPDVIDVEAPWLHHRPDRHPDDVRMLRLMTIANGSDAPIRGRALAMVADEAMRLAALEPPDGDSADAELIAACAEFDALERRVVALYTRPTKIEDDDAREVVEGPLYAAQKPLVARICALPATTPEGAKAKARSLATWAPDLLRLREGATFDEVLLASLLADLIGENRP